jgi:hypothetical protein
MFSFEIVSKLDFVHARLTMVALQMQVMCDLKA